MQKPVWLTRLNEQFEENPSLVLGAVSATALGAAKLIDSVSSARSRAAYAKQVKHSTSKKNRK